MFRRWLLRILFLLPILLCLLGWTISGRYCCVLTYNPDAQNNYGVATSGGQVLLFCDHGRWLRGWSYFASPQSLNFFIPILSPDYRRYFGFGTYFGADESGFAGPYWFLILFFSAPLYFVWRKTRPQPNPRTAFPVEVAPHNST